MYGNTSPKYSRRAEYMDSDPYSPNIVHELLQVAIIKILIRGQVSGLTFRIL